MVCCLCCDPAQAAPPGGLTALARSCSPRVEPHGADAVVFDVDGLSRVCGPPEVIAHEVTQLATAEGMTVRVAIAGTTTAAWILAHARAGITVVAAGTEAAALAGVPLGWLSAVIDLDRQSLRASSASSPGASGVALRRGRRAGGRHYRLAPPPPGATAAVAPLSGTAAADARQLEQAYRDRFATFARWGLRTCGDLAALPRSDVHARMGPVGVRLHQAACGEDLVPLVPEAEARTFVDRLALEWPIDGLEPLSFVLARQCDRLSIALEQADRGAVAITTRLTLVTREIHERVLHLPAPLREARVLRTLILLDLESHAPPAAIDVVELRLDVMPGRIVQGSLLARTVPSPESLSTLLARLGALMGESRIGAPVLLDTHDTRQVGQEIFNVGFRGSGSEVPAPSTQHPALSTLQSFAFRRFPLPLAARVTVDHGTPVRLEASASGMPGGVVVACAGPWRTSGGWWALDRTSWDRDEWDVELATGGVYRLARQRTTGMWEIEGVFD